MKIELAKKEIIHFIGIGGRSEWSCIDYEGKRFSNSR